MSKSKTCCTEGSFINYVYVVTRDGRTANFFTTFTNVLKYYLVKQDKRSVKIFDNVLSLWMTPYVKFLFCIFSLKSLCILFSCITYLHTEYKYLLCNTIHYILLYYIISRLLRTVWSSKLICYFPLD